jgi:hypothetical protein
VIAHSVRVRVNDDLILDVGTSEADSKGNDALRAPEVTLFRQLLVYLENKPEPIRPGAGSYASRDGVAATAMVLRWGSYLCMLLDRTKPVWPLARAADVSCIADQEMARINIEASAALAEWIDIRRRDLKLYSRLVDRAIAYLPMPAKAARPKFAPFMALASPDVATKLVEATHPDRLARARLDVERSASRVLANALVNVAWRNGPVEDIHAGPFRGYPRDRRRITPAAERTLLRFASERFASGLTLCDQFIAEQPSRPWHEQVLPYALAELLGITPSNWTLSDLSRDIVCDR